MENVGINSFVRRQTKQSGRSYIKNLTFKEIASHASKQIAAGNFENGYREGVILVQVTKKYVKHFICPLVKIDDNTKLNIEYTRRREYEYPYLKVRALNGTPLKTGKVELILYHQDVLNETSEAETNKEWELIAFHSIPEGITKLPMKPVTMMRNQLEQPGGTKGKYSSEEWAESIEFWQKYCFLHSD